MLVRGIGIRDISVIEKVRIRKVLLSWLIPIELSPLNKPITTS